MITKPCPAGGDDHEYPDDWAFGGPDGNHPGADSRYEPVHYQFLDALAGFSFMSGQFICDDQALDYFTVVAESDPSVKWIAKKAPGEKKFTVMPFVYIAETDTVHPYEWKET